MKHKIMQLYIFLNYLENYLKIGDNRNVRRTFINFISAFPFEVYEAFCFLISLSIYPHIVYYKQARTEDTEFHHTLNALQYHNRYKTHYIFQEDLQFWHLEQHLYRLLSDLKLIAFCLI